MKISIESQTEARKGPNRLLTQTTSQTLFVILLVLCHKEASKLKEYHQKFSSKLRLTFAYPSTGAYY